MIAKGPKSAAAGNAKGALGSIVASVDWNAKGAQSAAAGNAKGANASTMASAVGNAKGAWTLLGMPKAPSLPLLGMLEAAMRAQLPS